MVPIFIVTYDRLTVLRQCLESLKSIETPHQIIIHDNNSTYEPLREFLKEQQRSGVIVEWGCENQLVHQSIRQMVDRWALKFGPYYVVTDPDIALDTKPDVLEFYSHLLEETGVDCVGPQGIIDDIPSFNIMKQHIVVGHEKRFWSKPTKTTRFRSGEFEYSDQMSDMHMIIDTSFALYKTGIDITWEEPEEKVSIRTHPPYAARHLDWYIDPLNMLEDQRRYLWSAEEFSHCRQVLGFIPKML